MINHLSVILQNKLEGENYVDWKYNLYIVLIAEDYKFVLDTPSPPEPANTDSVAVKIHYEKWRKANMISKCYILASMSNGLLHAHQAMQTAAEIMQSLEMIFEHQKRTTWCTTAQKMMNIVMKEGTPVRDHVLMMMLYFNQIGTLGGLLNLETQVSIVLQSLPACYQQFKLDYELNKRNYTLVELLTELQTAESLMTETKEAMLAPLAFSSGFRPRKGNKKRALKVVVSNNTTVKKMMCSTTKCFYKVLQM